MNSIWMNAWYRPLHGDPRFEALVARIRAGGQPAATGSSAAPDSGSI